MAARRLVIVMLILLGASTLAAALVPVPAPEDDEREEQAPPKPPDRAQPSGDLVRESVRIPGGDETTATEGDEGADAVPTVRISLGDQLELTVHAAKPGDVEIPAFGELRGVGPATPAVFDLLPFDPGTYVVRLVGTERTIARIIVEPRRQEPERRGREEGKRSDGRPLDERTNDGGPA